MQVFGLISLIVTIAIIGLWFVQSTPVAPPENTEEQQTELILDPVIQADIDDHGNLIVLTSPQPNEYIGSPITITGKARGNWYFEASFPVVLTDWDGRIIAEKFATARGPWMTEDFVPFTVTFSFESPYHTGDPDFMRRGSLILKRDNPSGLPEHDDALEIPIMFNAVDATVPNKKTGTTYGEMFDQAEKAANSLEF
jgi:hypothetical protein